ncbi:transporter substrate-binding domain-containing protein [Noviherbaspirillum saxi]|uniref:Amino acid ABC transporter substrate-binding protein n=1 Tax=Noviherbaspirillum saxi TaxID=2320863 RepID=A0A3A3FYQ2_9BURK|nr:transporter substrate-binding domain-containing protein [Noviherbaspirillum saxi]RJF99331.1 amino acid ABC transporter substrate-binding protein [Noviherbaspirillum saxi]
MKKIQHIAAGVLATAMFGLSASCAVAGETLNTVLKTKELKVATNSDYAPQAFMNKNNQLDGFDVDVAKEIATRLGAKASFVTPGWEIMTAGRWSGRWHMVVGSVTPTKKRAEVLDFPAVYYFTPAVFAVHKESKAQKVSDLNDKTIGVVSASTFQGYVDRKLVIDAVDTPKFEYQVTTKKVRGYGDANELVDLAMGDGVRLDAVLQSLPTIKAAIDKGMPLKMLDKPVFYEPLAIATDKGDKEFNDKVAEIVAAMKKDGTLKKLSEKWYGIDYTTAQ